MQMIVELLSLDNGVTFISPEAEGRSEGCPNRLTSYGRGWCKGRHSLCQLKFSLAYTLLERNKMDETEQSMKADEQIKADALIAALNAEGK